MSETNHELMGRGGGLGKYQGLTISEVEDRFRQCLADPSMRSVTAVLRITREQIESRGQLWVYPRVALGFGISAPVVLTAVAFLPSDLKKGATILGAGLLGLTLILGYGVFTSRNERRASIAQENEIRRLAIEALDQLLNHSFRRKALTREHRDTLRDLMKVAPENLLLRDLLNETANA